MDKPTLRKIFINERNKMEPKMHKMLNHMLMASLQEELQVHSLKTIGIFYPMDNEVDVRALGKIYEVVYPKIEANQIVFYKDSGKWETSRFGVKEPVSSEAVDKADIDAVIVPGIVYDDALYRLGYGKGYYDAFLSEYKGLSIGVVFEKFRVEALPNKPHDIPVDMLVTDNQVYVSRHDDI